MRRRSIRFFAVTALIAVPILAGVAWAIGSGRADDAVRDSSRRRETAVLENRREIRDLEGRDGSSALYRIVVPEGASDLVVTAIARRDATPVDLYLRFRAPPDRRRYHAKDAGASAVKMVSIREPKAGTYHVLIRGAHGRYSGISLMASYAPAGSVFKLGMHAHRLYNGGDWNGPESPQPQFNYGVIRDWDISHLHDAAIWKSDGSIKFALVDRVYERHAAHGAKVIKTFGSVPTWASKRPEEPNKQYPSWPGAKSGPRDLDEYEDYVYRFVKHTKDALWAVEGWNEPYACKPERHEFATMTPTELADVQKRVYLATKRVSRDILVFSPAQAYVCGIPIILNARTSDGEPMWKFFDALAWHAYNRSARGNAGPSYAAEVSEVRRHLARAGLPDMPIADTEHGWLAPPKEGGREFYAMSDAEKGEVLHETALLAKSLGVLTVAWYGYENSMLGKPMASAELSRRLQAMYAEFNTR
ncbi:MAG TPA: hypothetical protein VEC35_18280 [Noviherbaspirillum sp.]|nr:hypothetical protein [Noviherbaspirillum sp.]